MLRLFNIFLMSLCAIVGIVVVVVVVVVVMVATLTDQKMKLVAGLQAILTELNVYPAAMEPQTTENDQKAKTVAKQTKAIEETIATTKPSTTVPSTNQPTSIIIIAVAVVATVNSIIISAN